MEDYLQLCKEVEMEWTFPGKFNIRIYPGLHQKIAKEAAEAGMSLNSWLVRIVTDATY